MKYGEVFEAGTGAEVVKELFMQVDLKSETEKIAQEAKDAPPATRKKVLRRLKLFQGMLRANIRPEWMFMDVLPVLPPDLRPMVQLLNSQAFARSTWKLQLSACRAKAAVMK
jgi:DNA-directed RNA polymerase subunit beta'